MNWTWFHKWGSPKWFYEVSGRWLTGFALAAASGALSGVSLTPGGAGVQAIATLDGLDDASVALDLGTAQIQINGQTFSGASQLFVSSNGLISLNSALRLSIRSPHQVSA